MDYPWCLATIVGTRCYDEQCNCHISTCERPRGHQGEHSVMLLPEDTATIKAIRGNRHA